MRFLIAVLVSVALPALAQRAENSGPPKDFAKGKGTGLVQLSPTDVNSMVNAEVSFQAESDPAGNNAKGVVHLRLPNRIEYQAVVTCLMVRSTSLNLPDGTVLPGRFIGLSADIVKRNDNIEGGTPLDGIRIVAVDSDRPELFTDRLRVFLEFDSRPEHQCQAGPAAEDFDGDISSYDE